MLRKSGFDSEDNPSRLLTISRKDLGQSCPQECPQLEPHTDRVGSDPLGEPMDIRGVSEFLGCSPWTVRQRHLPAGLPHFRAGTAGKLVFYRKQVVCWILERQRQKGVGL